MKKSFLPKFYILFYKAVMYCRKNVTYTLIPPPPAPKRKKKKIRSLSGSKHFITIFLFAVPRSKAVNLAGIIFSLKTVHKMSGMYSELGIIKSSRA
jgi:hypothetical protein